MPYASIAFYLLFFSLCFGSLVGCRSRSCGIGLHLYTLAYIKGFGSFLYAYLCLFASMLCIHACLSSSRLCHAWCPSWACSCVVTSILLVAYLGVTTCENASPWWWFARFKPFLRSMRWYAYIACFVPSIWFFFFSSLHACLHVHAWVLACLSHQA